MRVCHSPWLIAAYHGLHRLCVPRHPPHAIARLTTKNWSSHRSSDAFAASRSMYPSRARSYRFPPDANPASTGPIYFSFTSEHSKLASALQHQLFLLARVIAKAPAFRGRFSAPSLSLGRLPSHDLPFVPLSNSGPSTLCKKVPGEPSNVAANLRPFKSLS
jgi:hypothetical protein